MTETWFIMPSFSNCATIRNHLYLDLYSANNWVPIIPNASRSRRHLSSACVRTSRSEWQAIPWAYVRFSTPTYKLMGRPVSTEGVNIKPHLLLLFGILIHFVTFCPYHLSRPYHVLLSDASGSFFNILNLFNMLLTIISNLCAMWPFKLCLLALNYWTVPSMHNSLLR